MRPLRYFFYLAIFLTSLFASRQASLALFHPRIQINPINSRWETVKSTELPFSGQVNILLIHIPSLQEAHLISLWWIALAPHSPITMVNLYPTLQPNSPAAQSLQEHFMITQSRLEKPDLDLDFLKQLTAREIPWDGYLILDNHALATLIDYFGGVKLSGKPYAGSEVVAQWFDSELPPEVAYSSQVELWEALCEKSIYASSPASFELIRAELKPHVLVSPQFPLSLEDFLAFNTQTYKLSCEIKSTYEAQTEAPTYLLTPPPSEQK